MHSLLCAFTLSPVFRCQWEGIRNDLVPLFDSELSAALPMGVYRECTLCAYREKDICSGGCRARRALRLRPNALIALQSEPTGESRSDEHA